MMVDLLSGRRVLMTPPTSGHDAAPNGANGNYPIANSESQPETSYGPWSSRYCGHQFGVWAGQLGDGRAISILETAAGAGRQEIQLKGAGRTPFSRSADGLAVLRSGVREFLGSEGGSPCRERG